MDASGAAPYRAGRPHSTGGRSGQGRDRLRPGKGAGPLAAPTLQGSDPGWAAAFAWARTQALAHSRDGGPIGPWYEAALPGRFAFCVRDVCHQSTGAQVLGLGAHTKNMLRLLAASSTDARDWCPFWEIDGTGRPPACDDRDDRDFWYNLPGSFDLVACCYRQFQWTGDRDYLDDPVLRSFCDRACTEFVARWDRDGDGLPEHRVTDGVRGIASYNEQVSHPLQGGDLLAALHAALRARAALQDLEGDAAAAGASRRRARALRRLYHRQWAHGSAFFGHRLQDGGFSPAYGYEGNFLPLYFGLPAGRRRIAGALGAMRTCGAPNIEGLTYIADILLRYGAVDEALALLLRIARPDYPRSEYPEVSFCAAGALVAGLGGIAPDAGRGRLRTLARLPGTQDWLRLERVPLLGGEATVTHTGCRRSELVYAGPCPVIWRAVFPGPALQVLVDGRPAIARRVRRGGAWYAAVDVSVAPGRARTVCRPG